MSLVGKTFEYEGNDLVESVEVVQEAGMDQVIGRVTYKDGSVDPELQSFRIENFKGIAEGKAVDGDDNSDTPVANDPAVASGTTGDNSDDDDFESQPVESDK